MLIYRGEEYIPREECNFPTESIELFYFLLRNQGAHIIAIGV
jgi:hypothetical protein